jgi:hypothetical protein
MCRRLLLFATLAILMSLTLAVRLTGSLATAADEGRISGRLIDDVDGDADADDANEPGLVGWRVLLERDVEDGAQPLSREVRTGNDGEYKFEDLPPGNYSVSIPCDGQPKLWLHSMPGDGSYGTSITEDSPDNDYLDFFVQTIDEEPAKSGSIHGKLVWDENRDGIADPSEPGVVGWQVNGGDIYLRCFQQPVQVTHTAADGTFSFDGLMAGAYSISTIGPSGVPHPDYTLDAPGTTIEQDGLSVFWFQPIVDVPEGGTGDIRIGVLDISGGSTISGSIYADANGNGVRDAGEGLLDCDCWMGLMYRTPHGYAGVDSRITTAASHGEYSYSGLAGGDYWVAVMQPPGVATDPPAGPNSYPFRLISVAEGGATANVDFGIAPSPDSSLPTVVPTVVPTQAPDGGTPVPPASLGVSAPLTGSGGAGATDGMPWMAAAITLTVFGGAGAAYALTRLRRRV